MTKIGFIPLEDAKSNSPTWGPVWFRINLVTTRHIYDESWWGGAGGSALSWAWEPDLWCRRAMLVAQLCPTLCDPMDCNPPGSTVHGIFQARILEWVSISSSRGSSPPRDRTCISCIACGFFTIWAIRDTGVEWSSSPQAGQAVQSVAKRRRLMSDPHGTARARGTPRQLSHPWDGTRGSARASGDLGSNRIWGVQSLYGRGAIQVHWHHPNRTEMLSKCNAQLPGYQHHSPFHLCK